nr:PREDICTED: F-box only protein 25 [Latimeria chalumnae]|eukprot:XP_014349564.1 PREDICTED: F-box only protein 25 [Latimeria chalumnae]
MPFLGQDWRSPGWSWIKTEDGWKRFEFFTQDLENINNIDEDLQDVKNENLYGGGVCEVTAKKRKKDHFNNNTKSQYFYQEKWIFVQKESTRERHGYCTLGEAFNRLDFLSAIQDIRRFNYVAKQMNNGITLNDLPLHMQSNILYRFTDGWDIINLGQVTSALHMLSEDKHLWKKLCRYHFAEKQLCRHLILSEKGNVDWKLVYFTLQKCYPKKEQYGDTLQFCRHCSILFWKDTGHPCTANDPNSCFMPVSPQHFIDLFKF